MLSGLMELIAKILVQLKLPSIENSTQCWDERVQKSQSNSIKRYIYSGSVFSVSHLLGVKCTLKSNFSMSS